MPTKVKRRVSLVLGIGLSAWMAATASGRNIVVDAAPAQAVNSFSPPRALRGAIDRPRGGATKEENEHLEVSELAEVIELATDSRKEIQCL